MGSVQQMRLLYEQPSSFCNTGEQSSVSGTSKHVASGLHSGVSLKPKDEACIDNCNQSYLKSYVRRTPAFRRDHRQNKILVESGNQDQHGECNLELHKEKSNVLRSKHRTGFTTASNESNSGQNSVSNVVREESSTRFFELPCIGRLNRRSASQESLSVLPPKKPPRTFTHVFEDVLEDHPSSDYSPKPVEWSRKFFNFALRNSQSLEQLPINPIYRETHGIRHEDDARSTHQTEVEAAWCTGLADVRLKLKEPFEKPNHVPVGKSTASGKQKTVLQLINQVFVNTQLTASTPASDFSAISQSLVSPLCHQQTSEPDYSTIKRTNSAYKRHNQGSSRAYDLCREGKANVLSRLFDCVLVVGLRYDGKSTNIVPYVKTKYPANADVPHGIELLCFPDSTMWLQKSKEFARSKVANSSHPKVEHLQNHILVLTNEKGGRRFGYCRRIMPEGSDTYIPLAYCIISRMRAHMFYMKLLSELELRHGIPQMQFVALLEQLHALRFPPPGGKIKVASLMFNSDYRDPLIVKRPTDYRFENPGLNQLFLCVSSSTLLKLFSSLLFERQIILVSSVLSKLSTCVESLHLLLYPFEWQHTLVPVLPTNLLEVINAPTPYLVGVLSSSYDVTSPSLLPEEGMVVNLDHPSPKGGLEVVHCVGDEASLLPERVCRALKLSLHLISVLTESGESCQDALLSETFLRMFVDVCGHYQNHLAVGTSSKSNFQKESFIKSVESSILQQFLEWFTDTAMFNAFIQSRSQGSDSLGQQKGLFEEKILQYSGPQLKKNTRNLLRNSKIISKRRGIKKQEGTD